MRTPEDCSNIASRGTRLCAPLASPAARMLAISLLASLATGVGSARAERRQRLCCSREPQTSSDDNHFGDDRAGWAFLAGYGSRSLCRRRHNVAVADLLFQYRFAATAGLLPRDCRYLHARRPEPINIEVWLPLQNWNGKFVGIGNHGVAGEIEYADMGPHLVRGYAVGTTDTGHAGANATTWMQNPQQIINYGYIGVHEMTVKAKAIVTAAYGTATAIFLLGWLLDRGKGGPDRSPALSGRLRRHQYRRFRE